MQKTILDNMAPAFKGMKGDTGPYYTRSFVAEEDIPIGYPVMLGTNKETQVKKATSGAAVIGFALQSHTLCQTDAGLVQYNQGDVVSVLCAGTEWVEHTGTPVAGDVANLVIASGKLTSAAASAGIEAMTQIKVIFQKVDASSGLSCVGVK